jgi:type I restriction enzyme M protein
MAIKKSELYSSLWSSCDELRGGMDASQYKDYVLVMLFIKYVSDKYAGQPFAPITIPPGASFKDMVALKGKPTIGDNILGDAYEYLMRHFATESGKSKGQFYTPAEVSRIMARMNMILHDNPGAEIMQDMMQDLLTSRVRLD